MSSNNIAHISSVDKGLKMKIKRTKIPNKLDSKHEVVKTAAAVASSGSSVNPTSAAAASSARPSLGVASTLATSRTTGSLGLHTLAASVTATLALPSSTSVTLSVSSLPSSTSVTFASTSLSAGVATTSVVTMAVTNPTVALLKAFSVGMTTEANSAAGKSPLKAASPAAAGSDPKDGKSPKTKAAYSKKTKDNKLKSDISVCVGLNLIPVGNAQTVVESRTCAGMPVGTQPFNSPPLPPPPSPHTSLPGVSNCALTSEPRPGDTVHIKKENPIHDPYEFNAKVEDKIELPPKKLKLEKADCIETAMSPQPQHPPSPSSADPPLTSPSQPQQQQPPQKRSIGVDVCSVGVVTDPECLGPCEPGTLVGLEGIVWKETDNGLLVVNVTWRGKTYVGTLMDATRYAWAPPRPNGCDSPVSDFESRTPKGRGKRNCRNAAQSSERLPEGRRLRKGRRGTVNSSSSCFTAPPSPAKSDISSNNMKRKTKANDTNNDKSKRSRSCSRGLAGTESPTPDDYIVCPEPNCHKKYKHMNGLRYHRTHAHRKSSLTDDAKDEEEDDDEEDGVKPKKKERTTVSERAERMRAKERLRMSEQQKNSDSKDSLDDDIPLKEIASKVIGQSSSQRVDSVVTDKEKADDETSASINDLSLSVASVVTISSTVTSEATFAKPNASSLSSSVSVSSESVCQSQARDTHVMEVSSCIVSAVPSVTSTAESPQTVVSCSNKTSLPVITNVRSPVQQAPPAVTTAAAIPRLSQANNPQGVAATQTPAVVVSPNSQTTTTTSALAVTLSTDRPIAAKGPGFLKTITSVRPIVPAPSPQTAGMVSPHQQNSTSQSSPHSHGPTLKPIQPKPTIMGDYSVVSPALSDLTREKSRKMKKKKEKDSPGTVVTSQHKPAMKVSPPTRESTHTPSGTAIQDDMYKVDRSAPIRHSTPSKPFDTCSPTRDISKSPFHPRVDSPLLHSPYSDTASVSGPRLVIPPSTLAVSPNMENKSTIGEDVHSPAYSDISDANDSSSPVQQDSPKKDASLAMNLDLNGPPHLTVDGHPLSQHYGNMFYYGTPSNYLPHGISAHMASPTLSKGVIKSEYIEENRPSGSDANLQDKKEDAHSCPDSDLQQKSLIDYYARLHNMSPAAVQYHFSLAGLNPVAMDSPYSMLTHQTLAPDQKRLLQQDCTVKLEDGLSRISTGLSSSNHHERSDYEAGRKSKSGLGVLETSLEQKGIHDMKGQVQRDKNIENVQSLKDNVELKSMGHHHHQGGLPPQDQQTYQLLRQQNDILRAQMYQQQKQKVFESQRQDKRKGPPELTSASHISSLQSLGVGSRHLPDRATPDSIRKDIYLHRQDSKLDAADSKRFDIKEENTQSKASSSSSHELSKSRSTNATGALNIPPTSSVSSVPQSLQSSLKSSLPMPLVTSLQTAGHPGFFYPQFRPVQLDTMYRAINPHIIGYAGTSPAYIHPTVDIYRMPIVDPDRKPDTESQRGEVSGMVAAAGYPPVHKIHELHDKGRPSPGVHSPGPTKSAGGDRVNSPGHATPAPVSEKVKEKQREYTSSPPTQRHVHTHHHTHVAVYPPDAYSAMFGHPATAAIPTAPRAFPAHPPATPKS